MELGTNYHLKLQQDLDASLSEMREGASVGPSNLPWTQNGARERCCCRRLGRGERLLLQGSLP